MKVSAALSIDASTVIKMRLYIRYTDVNKDVHQILLRTKTMKTNMLNMNNILDEMAVHDFKFLLADLKR